MDTKNRILSFTFQLLPSGKYHQITDSKILILFTFYFVCECVYVYGFLDTILIYIFILFISRHICILYIFTFCYLYKYSYIFYHFAWGEGQTNICLPTLGWGWRAMTQHLGLRALERSSIFHFSSLYPQVWPLTLRRGLPSLYLDLQSANRNILKKIHTEC